MQVDKPYSEYPASTSSSSSSPLPKSATSSVSVAASGRGWKSLGRIETPVTTTQLPSKALDLVTGVEERRGLVRGRALMQNFGNMDLPGRPVKYILYHLYKAFLKLDPVFRNGYKYDGDGRVELSSENEHAGRVFWSALTFAKKLEAFAGLSPCWDLAVRALPFWKEEYAEWICCDRRFEIPDDNPVLHLSWIPQQGIPRCCTVCTYLFLVLNILPTPLTNSTKYHTLKTTDLGQVIVCSRHSALNVCGKCLIAEDVERDAYTGLVQMRDPQTWGDALCICFRCRQGAVTTALSANGYITIDSETNHRSIALKAIRHVDVQHYIVDGWGTIRDVLEVLDRDRWIMERSGIQGHHRAWLKKLTDDQYHNYLTAVSAAVRSGTCSSQKARRLLEERAKSLCDHGPKYTTEAFCRMQNEFLQYLAESNASQGYWITVDDQVNRADEATYVAQCCVDEDVYGVNIFRNKLYFNHSPVPRLDGMPATMYPEMTQLFVSNLDRIIAPFLVSIKNIFVKLAEPHYEIARAKALSMGAEELLEWIRDPRAAMTNRSTVVRPFQYPPIISDTAQRAAEAACNAVIMKRKRHRAGDEVDVEIAGEHGQVLSGSRPMLGIGGVARDSTSSCESGAGGPEDAQTSPFFNSKRRATSVAPRSSTSPASDGIAEGLPRRRRSSPDSVADCNSSDAMMQAGTNVLSPLETVAIPPTPSLTADYTEVSTPTYSRISSSDESASPILRPVIPPLSELPRSYVAAMVNTLPWPKPSPILSPEDLHLCETINVKWQELVPWFPLAGSYISPAVYSMITERWAKIWEDHEDCQCGICRREAPLPESNRGNDLMRQLVDLRNTIGEWGEDEDELEATGDEATDHTDSVWDPSDDFYENLDEETHQDSNDEN